MKTTRIILLSLFLWNCNTKAQKKTLPIITKDGFLVYKYTKQEHLDTLGYRFQLKKAEINQNTESWTTSQIQEFEQKINNLQSLDNLSSREYLSFPNDLLQYSKQGNIEERLPKIQSLLTKGKNIWISNFVALSESECVFDHLMINGTAEIQQKIKHTLIKKLYDGTPNDFSYIAPLLLDEKSDAYYNALLQMYSNVKENDFMRTDYYYSVLPELARVGGKKAIPFIFECFRTERKTTLNLNSVINHMAIILERLEQYHDIDKQTIKDIIKQTRQSGIMFYLYEFKDNPNKIVSDKECINTIIKKAQNSGLLPKEIPKRLEYLITLSYCNNHYFLDQKDFLETIKVKFTYNANPYAGSGHFLDKSRGYSTIMRKFMEGVERDLPNFYRQEYLRSDTDFTLFLGNDTKGYVIKLDKNKLLDENHVAISALFNTVLQQQNIEKRFMVKKDTTTWKPNMKLVTYEKQNAIATFLNLVTTIHK
ncbi:hypothetical protein [Aquimarina sp. I32.4]|uniref:hypothetical protein n=1 Tax=Aquimarina sp. I32.4 TaxID=2053903 RepID=UPI000CDF0763|nr:hypothetical protein [Aquimarina sp. I32.4]